MARVFFMGFDTGAALSEGITSVTGSGVTFDSAIVRTGGFSLKIAAVSGVATNVQPSLSPGAYSRIYVRVTALPATTPRRLTAGLSLRADGKLNVLDSAGGILGQSTTALTDTTRWYRIERFATGASQAGGTVVLRIDGADEFTLAGAATLSLNNNLGPNGTEADTYTVYYDDFSVDNAAFPGDGSVALLVPTADSAKGTGWVNDANGSTNFFDAVDNKPPTGIADTTGSTGLHQIRNGTSNANSSYDATMTTYAAEGITSADTINAVWPRVITGAPVSTGAKAGTVGVVSNPTIANIALGADGVSGAFWSGTAAGTYPTGWKVSSGTLTSSPSVTVGTAPVMRITQVTSSTRIAMVCFMGIYVDYTPAEVDTFVPSASPYPQLLPQ